MADMKKPRRVTFNFQLLFVMLTVWLAFVEAMPPNDEFAGEYRSYNVEGRSRSPCGPFRQCSGSVGSPIRIQSRPQDLCYPNPCGINAECRPGYDRSGRDRPVCSCFPGYFGNSLVQCSRPPISLISESSSRRCPTGNCEYRRRPSSSPCATGRCI